MTKLGSVSDFQFIERDPGYDKLNNPLRRSIYELVPLGIAWRCNGVKKIIQSTYGVASVPLADSSGIAIIEGPYDIEKNSAYIINCDGSVRAQINPVSTAYRTMFYEVLYIKKCLTFLASTPDRDIQIQVDEGNGVILRTAEFR